MGFSLTVWTCTFTGISFTGRRVTDTDRSFSLIVRKEGRHPTCLEMFQMTQARTTPDGSVMWSNEQSRQMMDQMTQLMSPTPSNESDGMAHHAVLSPEEAFCQVFGRDRPVQIRCGGRGQTLSSWYVPSEGGSSSNTAYQHLL
ncbi:hypothetical protein Taro_025838 [Colocasia esculenta]|uniref:Uncharacterized protein n=1 Tax=Colocasia esculenta TaxID=4460 RepID=A0A843VDD6_COLES|nr:hypothetical protein [Colocasia esculenta]